jgi:hypothetical protein
MKQMLEQAIRLARLEFDKAGRIATDTAAKLMQLGCIPHILEDQWSRSSH